MVLIVAVVAVIASCCCCCCCVVAEFSWTWKSVLLQRFRPLTPKKRRPSAAQTALPTFWQQLQHQHLHQTCTKSESLELPEVQHHCASCLFEARVSVGDCAWWKRQHSYKRVNTPRPALTHGHGTLHDRGHTHIHI